MKKNTLNAKFGIASRVGTASAFPTLHFTDFMKNLLIVLYKIFKFDTFHPIFSSQVKLGLNFLLL